MINTFQLRDKILDALNELPFDIHSHFNREDETLRVERMDNRKGVSVNLKQLLQKVKSNEKMVEEVEYYLKETLTRMDEERFELDKLQIYPIVRSTSFNTNSDSNKTFLTIEHTSETNILYAIDLEKSYRIIDTELMSQLDLTESEIKEKANASLKSLNIEIKNIQTVQENDFYFINHNDGYDATRILNQEFLNSMYDRCKGEMLVGLPHQDVLIIADVKNNVGYDIMAQMMMQYFAEGLTPITSLSFSYENETLTPIFILGKQKQGRKKDNHETDL